MKQKPSLLDHNVAAEWEAAVDEKNKERCLSFILILWLPQSWYRYLNNPSERVADYAIHEDATLIELATKRGQAWNHWNVSMLRR